MNAISIMITACNIIVCVTAVESCENSRMVLSVSQAVAACMWQYSTQPQHCVHNARRWTVLTEVIHPFLQTKLKAHTKFVFLHIAPDAQIKKVTTVWQ